MLYQIDVDIDYAGLGGQKDEILKQEHARTKELMGEGIAVAEYRRADARGVIAVWNCRSHEHLNELLRGLPIFPYLSEIRVTALVDHPLFPHPPAPGQTEAAR
jgi:muconolactone delta-isomerase